MKTDKELLELAAKAAGITGEWVDDYETGDYYAGQFYNGNLEGILTKVSGSDYVWNPLADDGDAFRLAVKLNITLAFDVNSALDASFAAAGVGFPRGVCERVINNDKEAAARRVIVRVSAAIGGSK